MLLYDDQLADIIFFKNGSHDAEVSWNLNGLRKGSIVSKNAIKIDPSCTR